MSLAHALAIMARDCLARYLETVPVDIATFAVPTGAVQEHGNEWSGSYFATEARNGVVYRVTVQRMTVGGKVQMP